MTQFTRKARITWISFASTTAKLWWLFLHSKSTLIREYPPRGTSQKPRVIQTCLHYPFTFLRAKCDLRCLLPKWSRCPGYSNYTREHHHAADRSTSHLWLVFIVSAALSQAKSWRTQSSTRKTLAKIQNFTPIEVISFLCIILWIFPNASHVHPKELSPRFIRHPSFTSSGINMGMGVYFVVDWGQRRPKSGVVTEMRMY